MKTTCLSGVLLIAMTTAAAAQSAPASGVNLQLSSEDQELIVDGEISGPAHIGGGLAAAFIGFGVGHAVQGRWSERGWIFTVGETASIGVMFYGLGKMATSCVDENGESCGSSGTGLVVGGALAVTALHLWETIDAFVAPVGHNRRVRAAKLRAGLRVSHVTPYLTPVTQGDGAVGGLSLRF